MTEAKRPADVAVEIMVVEDSPTQAEQLRHALERGSYRVMTASSGVQALESMADRHPSLVVSDIIMPGMDGYELCRRIKDGEGTRRIPVILLTSLTDAEDVLAGLNCGADSYITKPYDEACLLATIKRVLSDGPERDRKYVRMEVPFLGGKRIVTADPHQMFSLLLSSYEAAVRRNGELLQAQDKLRTLNQHLEDLVAVRTAALSSEIAEHERAEDKISTLNAELERRVSDRTRELESANTELEAFSYSVSHDLRAPLRAIDGFTQIVREDHAADLDEGGLQYLEKIRANVKRMDRLITDLLSLSRIGRSEMQKIRVDMGVLANATYLEIAEPELRGKFRFSAGALPDSFGDPTLLRQVWANLLSNAIKYTLPKDERSIEIGGRAEIGESVYFVKDSGVGFNPYYVSKLFGLFQRLHSSEAFEGTGVGLAIVKRIILRHGGLVWAEGKEGEGATFYFSLPSGTADR